MMLIHPEDKFPLVEQFALCSWLLVFVPAGYIHHVFIAYGFVVGKPRDIQGYRKYPKGF